jgi:hypothetical protein
MSAYVSIKKQMRLNDERHLANACMYIHIYYTYYIIYIILHTHKHTYTHYFEVLKLMMYAEAFSY